MEVRLFSLTVSSCHVFILVGATRTVRNKTCEDEMKICMNSWNKLNQNCFFIFQHKNSWLTAQETCQHYEGDLVKFNDKIELVRLPT